MPRQPVSGRDDDGRLFPHERRAIRHRERYHGRKLPTPPFDVVARWKWIAPVWMRRKGRAVCGFPTCPAELGIGSRPDPRSLEADWAGIARQQLESETYGERRVPLEPGEDQWTLDAPRNFPGFERMEDGSFQVIRSKKRRTLDGTLQRPMDGRRPERTNRLHSGTVQSSLDGRSAGANHPIRGWFVPLPSVVVCPLCGRRNLVREPDVDDSLEHAL